MASSLHRANQDRIKASEGFGNAIYKSIADLSRAEIEKGLSPAMAALRIMQVALIISLKQFGPQETINHLQLMISKILEESEEGDD